MPFSLEIFILFTGASLLLAALSLQIVWDITEQRDPRVWQAQRALEAGESLKAFCRREAWLSRALVSCTLLGCAVMGLALAYRFFSSAQDDSAFWGVLALFWMVALMALSQWLEPLRVMREIKRSWSAPLQSRPGACEQLEAWVAQYPELVALPAQPRELRVLDFLAARERVERASRMTGQAAILEALNHRQAARRAEQDQIDRDRQACAQLHARLGQSG